MSVTSDRIEQIRRGLAANLRALTECQVSPYLLDNPTGPTLQVAGFEGVDYEVSYGDTWGLLVVVEGATPLAGGSRAAYTRFDKWLIGTPSVQEVLESNQTLTGQLRDNGSVLENQDPVADFVGVEEFRGYRRGRAANGTEMLFGDWLVKVTTSG